MCIYKGSSDPCVTLYDSNLIQLWKSCVMKKNLNPHWDFVHGDNNNNNNHSPNNDRSKVRGLSYLLSSISPTSSPSQGHHRHHESSKIPSFDVKVSDHSLIVQIWDNHHSMIKGKQFMGSFRIDIGFFLSHIPSLSMSSFSLLSFSILFETKDCCQ